MAQEHKFLLKKIWGIKSSRFNIDYNLAGRSNWEVLDATLGSDYYVVTT